VSSDWHAVDDGIAGAVRALRAARNELRMRAPPAGAPCPVPAALVDAERLAEARSEGGREPLAARVADWLETLARERVHWSLEFETARAHHAAPIDPVSKTRLPSSRDLVRATFAGPTPAARQDAARALATRATEAGPRMLSELEARFGSEGPAAGARREQASRLAVHLLARTDAMAREQPRAPAWWEALHAALGRAAADGWPARLHARWAIDEALGGTRADRGLALALGRPPEPLGALSFARALGRAGVALLEASRGVAFALHDGPEGLRRRERYALFAAICAEPSFAARVLGHGRGRARDHGARVASAMLISLRIDALRALCLDALGRGRSAAAEIFAAEGDRILGSTPPPALLGVLPRLRTSDAPRLVGAVLAVRGRDALVERFDEDWFRNPRALEALRAEDALADTGARHGEATTPEALERLAELFERAL
jgi:hypothetical protein